MRSFYFLEKDLRLRDNQTLKSACEASEKLNLVYTVDESFKKLSSSQKHFVYESLKDLSSSLKKKDSRLYIYEGSPKDLIVQSQEINQVFLSKVYNSRDQKKIEETKDFCEKKGVSVFEVENTCLYKIKQLPFEHSEMPKVFTNFRKEIEKRDLNIQSLDAPEHLPPMFNSPAVEFKDFKNWQLADAHNPNFIGGESEGQRRLNHYLWETDAVQNYKETRNGMLIFDDSTKFSPWLAVGALSPRDIMVQLKFYEDERGANESTYWVYFELLWREYFKLYSLKYGSSIFDLKGISQKKVKLSEDQDELFIKWSDGRTGNDFIDANMNELKSTGWMSNRGRQNVASYLSKEISVDWRWGADWFAKHLIDYDVESNWGNWNYVAGVGVDPRDRKFNIKRQSEVYDPEGEYIKKFLDQS